MSYGESQNHIIYNVLTIITMSKSTLTLSKKEKMNQKYIQKNRQKALPPRIEISSDDDQQLRHNPLSFPIKSNQSIEPPKKHNCFNPQVLKKYIPTKKQKLPIILKYQVCDGVYEPSQYNGRDLISYKLLGQQSKKYISENHLRSRIQRIDEDIEKKQSIIRIQSEENGEEKIGEEEDSQNSEKQEKGENDKQKKNVSGRSLRYFDIVPQQKQGENIDEDGEPQKIIKCFRCGQVGHMARNCHQQAQKQKCMFCLGDHHHSQCNDKLCFRCSNPGHVSQECKSDGLRCRKCKKIGHIQRNCGAIIMMDYMQNNDSEIKRKFGNQNLNKLRCLNNCKNPKGHFNCFQYHKKPPKIYDEAPKLKGRI